MLPSVESLRCFLAAAETLNFRAAARAVFLTPAALGQRIRQLEGQIEAPLFRRTTRSVTLTPAGLAMLPHARRALSTLDDCVRAARGNDEPAPAEITLGTRHELGMSWLIPQIPAIRAQHRGLTLHLYFGAGEDLLLRIRTREVDCAVTSTRFSDPKLDAFRLHREEYVFVGSQKLLRRQPFTRPEHAAAHTLIDAGAELPLFGYWRDAPGGGDRLRFARLLRIGTIAAIERYVLDGIGVAVLPRYLVEPALRSGRLRTIFPSVTPRSDYFRLVYRADDPRRALYEALSATMLRAPLK